MPAPPPLVQKLERAQGLTVGPDARPMWVAGCLGWCGGNDVPTSDSPFHTTGPNTLSLEQI